MITAEELAHSLNTTGKALRSWLRKQYPHEANAPWLFTPTEAAEIRRRWRQRITGRVVVLTAEALEARPFK